MQWNDEKYKSGLMLLKLFDKVEAAITYAVYFFSEEDEEWKFVIATPLLEKKGPFWLVENLVILYRNNEFPKGISPLDIVILKPEDGWANNTKLTQHEIEKEIFEQNIIKKKSSRYSKKFFYRLSVENKDNFCVYSIENIDRKPFFIDKNQSFVDRFEQQIIKIIQDKLLIN